MSRDTFSTENLDYLQRTGPKFALPRVPPSQAQVALNCNGIQIRGVGRLAKASASETRQTAINDWQLTQLISEDLLIGLHGMGRTVVFVIAGDPGSVHLYLGLNGDNSTDQDSQGDTKSLTAILNGVYPGIELSEPFDLKSVSKRVWSKGGLALGIPTAKPPDLTDGAFALDRLIRSMSESAWQAIIVAEPSQESSVRAIRGRLIAEMRSSQSSAAGVGTPNPLVEHYNRLLSISLDELTHAQAVGAWRTAVYLLGVEDSYYRLAGAWRSLFSGSASLPEPVRVWEFPDAIDLANTWAIPSSPEANGPGQYTHPYKYQTILSSSQLAAYIHLPQLETRGFTVKLVPEFDVVPALAEPDTSICVGNVIDRTQKTDVPYWIPLVDLSKHALVTGVTGAGKTNTVFHLLREAFAHGIPSLVIEPAKKEYRALLDDPNLGKQARVFTAADESTSPIRINPFEVLKDAPLSVHIDLLRSVFSSSFGMWVPLPQILEKCMLAIYEDRGWDVLADDNQRLRGGEWRPDAFPTLTDLVMKIEEVVPTLGFDPEAQGRILASLTSRVNGLRSGGKGRMFDVQESVSMDELLRCPTVLELESMGDDDDKAFIMGLLLIRLVEHRRLHGPKDTQHILVIEEAHRLLGNVSPNLNQEQSDPRGKAVETFSNLLSEIRAYGQAILIADQIPTRLAPDVVKNTNLKIVHRIVSGDDREILGKAMAMSARQIAALTSLQRGEAAVFSGASDDAPILVKVKQAKEDRLPDDILSGDRIRKNIAKMREGLDNRIFRQNPACEDICPTASAVADDRGTAARADADCRAAASLLETAACRSALSRLVLSIIENPSTADRLWTDVKILVQARRTSTTTDRIFRCLLVRGAAYISRRRGAQHGWTYKETDGFEAALRDVLLALIGEGSKGTSMQAFQDCALVLHKRGHSPFSSCEQICSQRADPVCLYRFAIADLLTGSGVGQGADLTVAGQDATLTLHESLKAGWKTVASEYEASEEESAGTKAASIRAALCYLQQAISRAPNSHVRDREDFLAKVIEMGRMYERGEVREQDNSDGRTQ